MGGLDFSVVLWIALFLFSIWAGGRAFTFLKLPAILGQIALGMIFGPKFLDIVPYGSNGACDSIANPQSFDTNTTIALCGSGSSSGSGSGLGRMLAEGRMLASAGGSCTSVEWGRWPDSPSEYLTSIWPLIGNIGVTLMIMESGMHIHFEKVRLVGIKAFVVAVFGTLLPLISGMGLITAFFPGEPFFGFAAGCAFAPTSVGISIKLLEESKMLSSLAGQTTLTAAFIDDVFSLITLAIMIKLAEGAPTARDILVPLFGSFIFLGFSVFAAIYIFSHLHKLLNLVPDSIYASIAPRDELHLFIMLFTLCVFGFITWVDGFIGSHLLGAFGAGICFVNVPRSHAIWQAQMKRIIKWMMRIFFAATVGFAIPIQKMMTGKAFGIGLALGVGPVIGTKIISGLFASTSYSSPAAREKARAASWATKCFQPQQLLVGIAMVARGEFAYLVADTAQGLTVQDGSCNRLMSEEAYASVMWGLVMATVFAPFAFRWAIGVYERAFPMKRSSSITQQHEVLPDGTDLAKGNCESKAFKIRLAAKHHIGVQREVLAAFHAMGMDCREAHVFAVHSPGEEEIDAFVGSYGVISRGRKKDFDDEKLEEMHHTLDEILDDPNCQIIFEAPKEDDLHAHASVVEVQVLGEYHPDILHEVTDKLSSIGLDVLRAVVDHDADATDAEKRKSKAEGEGAVFYALRDVFYARESDGTANLSLSRRGQIKQEVTSVQKALGVSGTCSVRVLHESEMPSMDLKAHHFEHEDKVCVINCTGQHHKELLHEILDHLFELNLDVLHAEMNVHPVTGDEVHKIYIQPFPPKEGDGDEIKPLDSAQQGSLRLKISTMYEAHGLRLQSVSVEPVVDKGITDMAIAAASSSMLDPAKRPPSSNVSTASPSARSAASARAAVPSLDTTMSKKINERRKSRVLASDLAAASAAVEAGGSSTGGISRLARASKDSEGASTVGGSTVRSDQVVVDIEEKTNPLNFLVKMGQNSVELASGSVKAVSAALTPKASAPKAGASYA